MAVPAGPIVEHLDVIEDIGTSQITCFVHPFLDAFFLQATKEGLRNGIVPAIAPATHAGIEVVLATEALPVVAAILGTLVGMDQHTSLGPALPDRHQQGIKHDLPGQRWLHRPPDYPTGMEIHHHRQIQPTLPGPDIGDVRDPSLVRPGHGELAVETIGRQNRWSSDHTTRCLVAPQGLDFILTHDPSHAMPATSLAGLSEVRKHPRRTVHAGAGRIRLSDQGKQTSILESAIRQGLVHPGIKATTRGP